MESNSFEYWISFLPPTSGSTVWHGGSLSFSEMETAPPAAETQNLNHWIAREVSPWTQSAENVQQLEVIVTKLCEYNKTTELCTLK